MQNHFLPSETTEEITPYAVPSITPETAETTETLPDAQAVATLLAQAKRTDRQQKRRVLAVFVLFEATLMSPFVWSVLHHGYWNPHLKPYSSLFTLLSLYLPFCALFGIAYKRNYLDMEALTRVGGSKAIPFLLESLRVSGSHENQKAVLRALIVLLPKMRASDASLLTWRHRHTLNALLRQRFFESWMNGADYSLALAILKAYEQVGDAKAIPIVERLAKYRTNSEGQRKIQEAAQECLPLLRANAGGVETTQTLLRASMPDTNTLNTLLRAATPETNAHKDDLLRAANANDAPPTP